MFLHTLSQVDRERLRAVVKRVHLRHNPKEFINDYEADKFIETLGPEVAEKMIRRMAVWDQHGV